MKKLLLLLLVAPAFAYAQSRNDGNWWSGLDKTAKTYYLVGFMNGRSNAFAMAPAYICMNQRHIGKALEECISAGVEFISKEQILPISGKPYGQFIEGINTFYRDYRNKSICFNPAIHVVISSMNGMKNDDADNWIQKLRAIPATYSCD